MSGLLEAGFGFEEVFRDAAPHSAPLNDRSRFVDDGAPSPSDVPAHVNDTVNPFTPWTPEWYDWFGGSVPEGIFGPGASACDAAQVYIDALTLCCARSATQCDPTTTGVLYAFVGADCRVEDALCYTVSDGVVAPDGDVWGDILEAIEDWWYGDPEIPQGGDDDDVGVPRPDCNTGDAYYGDCRESCPSENTDGDFI